MQTTYRKVALLGIVFSLANRSPHDPPCDHPRKWQTVFLRTFSQPTDDGFDIRFAPFHPVAIHFGGVLLATAISVKP
jgi:hypothetical protein